MQDSKTISDLSEILIEDSKSLPRSFLKPSWRIVRNQLSLSIADTMAHEENYLWLLERDLMLELSDEFYRWKRLFRDWSLFTLSMRQQQDDYLGPIMELVKEKEYPYPKFFMKDDILHRTFMLKHSKSVRQVVCWPDALMPSALHKLHVALGHASVTQTLRHFMQNLYNKNAKRMMMSCIEACIHCALPLREEAQKAPPEPRPKRPRHKKGKKSEQKVLKNFLTISDADTAAEGTVNANLQTLLPKAL